MSYFLNAIIDYGSMCINARTSIGLLNETHVEDEMQSILLENPVEWLLKTSCAMNLLAQQSLQGPPPKKKNAGYWKRF